MAMEATNSKTIRRTSQPVLPDAPARRGFAGVAGFLEDREVAMGG
jgi:hypothetical protein